MLLEFADAWPPGSPGRKAVAGTAGASYYARILCSLMLLPLRLCVRRRSPVRLRLDSYQKCGRLVRNG